jgi:hypothetical protein
LSFYSSYKHKTPKNIFCQYSKLNISGAMEGACGDNFGRNMSHNVPAVYDVFAARIRALRSKDQGCKNVAEFWRGNGAQRNDLAKTEPEPPTGGEA